MPQAKSAKVWQERIRSQCSMPTITDEDRKKMMQEKDTKCEPYGTRPMVVRINGVWRQVFVD